MRILTRYLDIAAGNSVDNDSGGDFLRDYIRNVQAANNVVPKPTLANFQLINDSSLQDVIAPYTVVELADGRTMAVISVFDAKYLTALSTCHIRNPHRQNDLRNIATHTHTYSDRTRFCLPRLLAM